MKNPRVAAGVSAGIFILVTFWTFWNLQDSGPVGTFRRFIELAGKGDGPGLNRAIAPSGEQLESLSAPEKYLVRLAHQIGTLGTYRVSGGQPDPRTAIIYAQFENPAGGLETTTWVLRRPNLRWSVDLKATVEETMGIGTNIAPEP